MNGEPLPIEHGFPVRTLVPGLYGYVSACKWVVDMEVTRFDKISAYWTERGWAELGPVKMSSRIDVPRRDDEIGAGDTRVGGVAWSQHTGISAVEVSLDGGAWQSAELGNAETIDSWAQWSTNLTVEKGDHTLRVRATDNDGLVQTGAVRRRAARRCHRAGTRCTSRPCEPYQFGLRRSRRERVGVVVDDVHQPPDVGSQASSNWARSYVVRTPAAVSRRGVVDDHVAVGGEADDHDEVAVARGDVRAGQLAAAERDRGDQRDARGDEVLGLAQRRAAG